MNVSVKDLWVNMDLGNNGVEFDIYDTAGNHLGDLRIGKAESNGAKGERGGGTTFRNRGRRSSIGLRKTFSLARYQNPWSRLTAFDFKRQLRRTQYLRKVRGWGGRLREDPRRETQWPRESTVRLLLSFQQPQYNLANQERTRRNWSHPFQLQLRISNSHSIISTRLAS